MDYKKIDDYFTYHNPTGIDPRRFELIRGLAKDLAIGINTLGGIESEKELAILKLRECIFHAIASIVLPI